MCYIDRSIKIKTNKVDYNNLHMSELDDAEFIDYKPTDSYIHLFSVIISLIIYFIILFKIVFYLMDSRK